jgi:hypothetical protein
MNILVIDSEGIGSLDQDSTHDSRIFSLSLLLSSFFIYNSVGSIDENAIEGLSLIVNLTKNIQINANAQNDSLGEEDYARVFPKFLWILRDFALQLVDSEGEKMTCGEYLERALRP